MVYRDSVAGFLDPIYNRLVARERFHTSVTERASFRDCRRAWYLDVHERLQPRNQVRWYLIYGDVMHAALEAYYKKDRNLTSCLSAFRRAWKKQDVTLQQMYQGFYENGIGEEWHAYKEKGETTLRYYEMFDRQHPYFDEILDVNIEARAFIEILDPETRKALVGHPLLSGKIDVVGLRKGRPGIMDHKNLSSFHDSRSLDLDDQLTGYCYIYWRLEGVIPFDATYNVLIKDPPKPPRLLKDGSLSKDKSQRTTYDLYLQAIKENKLSRGDYGEILGFLRDKGWDQFFRRESVQRSEEELLNFERRLFYEYEDMQKCLEDPERAYPNPGQRTCPGCQMMSLCQAMEEGGDPDYIREQMYEVGEQRVLIPKGV